MYMNDIICIMIEYIYIHIQCIYGLSWFILFHAALGEQFFQGQSRSLPIHRARRKKPGMHLTEVERLLQQIDRELGRLWETLAINNYHQLP